MDTARTTDIDIHKTDDTDIYKRYYMTDKKKTISGRIVLEKCGEVWNLELMDVHLGNLSFPNVR